MRSLLTHPSPIPQKEAAAWGGAPMVYARYTILWDFHLDWCSASAAT